MRFSFNPSTSSRASADSKICESGPPLDTTAGHRFINHGAADCRKDCIGEIQKRNAVQIRLFALGIIREGRVTLSI